MTDSIHQLPVNSFDSADEYYSTAFHELIHSTGHPSRLHRRDPSEIARFGCEAYSREELVTEFGAAYLCAKAGINNALDNSAAYIQSSAKALRNDKRLAVTAASAAQKAADYILGPPD